MNQEENGGKKKRPKDRKMMPTILFAISQPAKFEMPNKTVGS